MSFGKQMQVETIEQLDEFLDEIVELLIDKDGDEVVEISIANQTITLDSGFDDRGWPETRRFRVYDNIVEQICKELGERDQDGILEAIQWSHSNVVIKDHYLA